MSALAELQQRFKAQVLYGGAGMAELVVGNFQADAATRIGVYAEAYSLRLIEVLGIDHSALRKLAGTERFEQLCRAYIDAHPSPHYNARWYGEKLSAFLATTPPWRAEPALAEMAALEWDLTLAFDAVDSASASFADILALAPEQWPGMFLRLQPAFRHRPLRWNVAAIRLAIDHDAPPPALERLEPMHEGAQEWAIWRRDMTVRHRALEADEAGVLNALEGGMTFGDLCSALCQWHSEDVVALRAAQLLKTWIEEQWLGKLDPIS